MKSKKLSLVLILLCLCMIVGAKTTYIPTYFSRIDIQGSAKLLCDSSVVREFTMMADDGRYAITVIQDSVTKERVKAIKHAKAAAGWSAASAVLSGVSATLQPLHTGADAVRYMNSVNNMETSLTFSALSSQKAADLQRVPVSIYIENFTEREMVINDLSRGLTWYLLPHSFINLTVGNPEINRLRIAYSDSNDQKKDYITVMAANELTKRTIALEDSKYWYFANKEEYVGVVDVYEGQNTGSRLKDYERVDKFTFEHSVISCKDFELVKKSVK